MTIVGKVREIWQYPVKSMFGSRVNSATLSPRGMASDRNWAVIDQEVGKITHGRKLPRLLTLKARYIRQPTGEFDETIGPLVEIEFPDGRLVSSDDPWASALLSQYLGRQVVLATRSPSSKSAHHAIKVPMLPQGTLTGMNSGKPVSGLSPHPLEKPTPVADKGTLPGAYYDMFPIHIMTTATLDRMKQVYPAGDFRVERYRPNLLIETPENASGFIENQWTGHKIRIGDSILYCDSPTIRCSIPGAEQPGMAEDPKIPQAVAEHANQFLGIYCSPENTADIQVGDEIELVPRLFPRVLNRMRSLRSAVVKKMMGSARATIARDEARKPGGPKLPRGFVPYLLNRRKTETNSIVSFFFVRKDGEALPSYIPGQHIVLALTRPDSEKLLYRPYTLSGSGARPAEFRISVQLETFELAGQSHQGTGSFLLHHSLSVGDEVHIKGPTGQFGDLPSDKHPLILACTGIGITPMMSILNTLASENPERHVSLIYGVRSLQAMAFQSELEKCRQRMSNLVLKVCVSQETESHNFASGRVTASDIVSACTENSRVLLCGTQSFVQDMRCELAAAGIEKAAISSESFIQRRAISSKGEGQSRSVEFLQSDLKTTWTPNENNLLEFAESQGMNAAFGCRYGVCQACEATLLSGDVGYPENIELPTGKNKILLCCTRPKTDLVIDL